MSSGDKGANGSYSSRVADFIHNSHFENPFFGKTIFRFDKYRFFLKMLVQKWKYFLNYVEFAVPAIYFTITLILLQGSRVAAVNKLLLPLLN